MKAYDAYYHANPKGTGAAVKLKLNPAHEATAGSIVATIAPQKTVGTLVDGVRKFPTFDWDRALKVKLDRDDLAKVLQVLRGFYESINDSMGIFHRSEDANTVIKFSHVIEPVPGYLFEVVRKCRESGEQTSIEFLFSMNEAFALMLSLERALMYVCFGIPEVKRAANN